MNCEELRAKLDAYVDGALNEQEIGAMLEHTKICEDCARELAAAETLRDTLREIDAQTTAPLEAQAAWRDAVRREAGKRNLRKKLRGVYAAAAALIVLAGCMAAFGSGVFTKPEPRLAVEPALIAETDASAIVAKDGMAADTSEKPDYAARQRILTRDMRAADETVKALCAEYAAVILSENDMTADERASKTYRIELPYDYMEDFLRAAVQIGDVQESEVCEDRIEPAVVELQIAE